MRISIVTPSFQSSKWLTLCVNSVADQEGVEMEHLVQDAGSTDGTLDWLLLDKRVKTSVESDHGMYDAINRGLKRAAGDVLAFLNCDEQYLPGVLAKVTMFFERHPSVDLAFGDAILVNQNVQPISYRRIVLPGRSHTRLVHLATMSCATFFRRKIIERGFFFDERWRAIGDQVWMAALLDSGIRMACMKTPCAAFAFTGKNLGSAELSMLEGDEWRAAEGVRSGWLRIPSILSLRARKLLAGAYGMRSVHSALYTFDSPTQRVPFHSRLGYAWPQE